MPDTSKTRIKPNKPSREAAQPAAKAPLRARPKPGKSDHAALTRKIIARFPKILAALAK